MDHRQTQNGWWRAHGPFGGCAEWFINANQAVQWTNVKAKVVFGIVRNILCVSGI